MTEPTKPVARCTVEDPSQRFDETLDPDAREIKIARFVGVAHGDSLLIDEKGDPIDDAFGRFALCDDIETFGQIQNWRQSEIERLAI
ncbi:MAG: hypothetical protein AAFR46_18780 [Pseudomonadota bacterium]